MSVCACVRMSRGGRKARAFSLSRISRVNRDGAQRGAVGRSASIRSGVEGKDGRELLTDIPMCLFIHLFICLQLFISLARAAIRYREQS